MKIELTKGNIKSRLQEGKVGMSRKEIERTYKDWKEEVVIDGKVKVIQRAELVGRKKDVK
jgi:hypothetical protein